MLQVQRKTLEGASTAYTFTKEGIKFLVKNLSEEDCYVNYEAITNDNLANSILVPAQTAQIILTDEVNCDSTAILYVKGTGVVEVQVILCR